MKNQSKILNELNLIAQKGDTEKQIQALKYLIHNYAFCFRNEIKDLNNQNVQTRINDLYFIISKY